MMSKATEDASLGRGKHMIVKNKAIAGHEQSVHNSDKLREKLAHTKQVRAQGLALEEQEAALEAADKVLDKATKAKEKAKPKPKAGPKVTSKSSSSSSKPMATATSKAEVPLQEKLNTAQVVADDKRWKKLITLLQIHDSLPEAHLKSLILWELEKIWQGGERSQLVQGKANQAKPVMKGMGKEKAVAKTPAKKVSSSLPKESKITWLGLPMVPLDDAKDQSRRAAAPSPLAKTRKHDLLADCSDVAAKRSGTEVVIIQSLKLAPKLKSKAPSATRAGSVALSTHSSGLRAGSSAPTRALAHATSSRFASREPVLAAIEDPMSDVEYINTEVGFGDILEDDEMFEEEDIKPLAKKKSTNKKNRPTSGQYEGVERAILDEAILQVVCLIATREPCPDSEEYKLMINEAWDNAATWRYQQVQNWPIMRDHITCIKQQVNSWCGCVHRWVALGIAGAYNLSPSAENTPVLIQAHAIALGNKEFHRDPKPIDPGQVAAMGNYRHPYIAIALHKNAVPHDCIKTFLKRYQVNGTFNIQAKVTVDHICGNVLKHHQNILKMAAKTPLIVEDMQEAIYAAAMQNKTSKRRQSKATMGVLKDEDLDAKDITPKQLAVL
ncbi:hypothetical protein FS749_009981 [Ceratobasidium sp. UAMH 11750]|nr:hypothetical protein FS749_009981 [Ceratobasidium sp. UAMH 11750]